MRNLVIPFLALACMTLFADSLSCYKENMVDAILRIEKRGYVFETFLKWGQEGNNRDLLNHKFTWAYRDGNGHILNDAEFLDKIGQEQAAQRMRDLYQDRKRTGNLRMFIGTPLGIAMTTIGVLWLDHNFQLENPSTMDQAGAVVLGVSGIGVSVGSLISYFTTRNIDPYDHEITRLQTLDMIDRHNNAVVSRCRAKEARRDKPE